MAPAYGKNGGRASIRARYRPPDRPSFARLGVAAPTGRQKGGTRTPAGRQRVARPRPSPHNLRPNLSRADHDVTECYRMLRFRFVEQRNGDTRQPTATGQHSHILANAARDALDRAWRFAFLVRFGGRHARHGDLERADAGENG